MRDKVPRHCPQTTTFEEKGEPKQIRTQVLLLNSLTPYRWAKPAHTVLLACSSPPSTVLRIQSIDDGVGSAYVCVCVGRTSPRRMNNYISCGSCCFFVFVCLFVFSPFFFFFLKVAPETASLSQLCTGESARTASLVTRNFVAPALRIRHESFSPLPLRLGEVDSLAGIGL